MAYTKVGPDGKEVTVATHQQQAQQEKVMEQVIETTEASPEASVEATQTQQIGLTELEQKIFENNEDLNYKVLDKPLENAYTKNETVAIQIALYTESIGVSVEKKRLRLIAQASKADNELKTRVKGWPRKGGEIIFGAVKLREENVIQLFHGIPDTASLEWLSGYQVKKSVMERLDMALKELGEIPKFSTAEEKRKMADTFELTDRVTTAIRRLSQESDTVHRESIMETKGTPLQKAEIYISLSLKAVTRIFVNNYIKVFHANKQEFYETLGVAFFNVLVQYVNEKKIIDQIAELFDDSEKPASEETAVNENQNQSQTTKEENMSENNATQTTATPAPAAVEVTVNVPTASPVATPAPAVVTTPASTTPVAEKTDLEKFLEKFDEQRKIETMEIERKFEEVNNFRKEQLLTNKIVDKRLESLEEKVFGSSAAEMLAKIKEDSAKEAKKDKEKDDNNETVYVTSGLTTTETIMVASGTVAVVGAIGIGIAYLLGNNQGA